MALSAAELNSVDPLAVTNAVLSGRSRRSALEIWIPACLLGVILGSCLIGPLTGLLPKPNATDFAAAHLPIGSPGHLLGTDQLGRDLLSRALSGGRLSFLIGVAAVVIGLIAGGAAGVTAGFRGGAVDSVIMRILDVLLAFPSLVLALAVAAYLGPSVQNVIFAISFFSIPFYARIARATTLKLRQRDFVLSAQLAGVRPAKVALRHIVPNVLPDLLSYGVLLVGVAMILEASLSYLGLGVRPPEATWGTMIADAQNDLVDAPYMALVPGAFLFLTVILLNLLGDGIRAGRGLTRALR